MTTISDKIKACEYVINNLLDEQERIIYAHENEFIKMNTAQFDEGLGSDGKILNNTNPIFDGRYSLFTQIQAEKKPAIAPKIAGELYNFAWTGDFLSGLQLEIRPNAVQFDIFSTGTGTGDKSIFFAGYTNLFGISDTDRVNSIIYEDLMLWVNKYI